MAEFTDLLKDVEAEVPGCPEPVMDRELHDAAYDFCRRTGIWREQLEPVSVADGVTDYELLPPFWARVDKILWATYGQAKLTAKNESTIRNALQRQDSPTGDPTHYAITRDRRNGLVVYPVPGSNQDKSLVVYAILLPTRASDEIPDWLADEWQDAIVHGALDRLQRQRAEWGDIQRAQDHRADFHREIARAKREALSGYGAQTRVKPQGFGA